MTLVIGCLFVSCSVLLLLILTFNLIMSLVTSYVKLVFMCEIDFVLYARGFSYSVHKLLTGFNLMHLGHSISRSAINQSW